MLCSLRDGFGECPKQGFGGEGARALAAGLASNKTLREIDLMLTNMVPEGQEITDALKDVVATRANGEPRLEVHMTIPSPPGTPSESSRSHGSGGSQ